MAKDKESIHRSTKKKSTRKRSSGKRKASDSNQKKPSGKKKTVTTRKSTLTSPTKSASKAKPNAIKRVANKKTTEVTNLASVLLYGKPYESFRLVNPRTGTIERVVDREEMHAEMQLRDQELRDQYGMAQKAIKKVRRWIRNGYFGERVGCTIGLRTKFGHIVSPLRYVIQIHVPFKLSDRKLQAWPKSEPKSAEKNMQFAVPDNIDGILTKVMETDAYLTEESALSAASSSPPGTVRIRSTKQIEDILEDPSIPLATTEIIGGIPTVESSQSNWGTMGIVIRDSVSTKKYAIVNGHFADGEMVQPPHPPQESDSVLWSIGSVLPGSRIQRNVQGDNRSERFYVDAALIELNSNRSAESFLVHEFGDEPLLFAQTALRHHHANSDRRDVLVKVYKFGAKTLDRIEGFIENPEDESVVIGGRVLGKVIRARRNGSGTFTLNGDSGSALIAPIYDLVTRRERLLVVGLCFAGVVGDNEVLYACQFASLIKVLGLNLPANLVRNDWRYRRP